MKQKLVATLVALSVIFGLNLVVAAPASAHLTLCPYASYRPESTGAFYLRGDSRAYCPSYGHQTSMVLVSRIWYKVNRSWALDYWVPIDPAHKAGPKRWGELRAQPYVECVGIGTTKTYRTKTTLYLNGANGSVVSSKPSGEFTMTCGKMWWG